MDSVIEDLRTFIAERVREGFDPFDEILQTATEYALDMYDGDGDDLEPEIKRLTEEALAAHRAEQSTWNVETDCDRLDEAFTALNRHGIVARQHFTCCNTCGFTEIWDEIEEEEQRQQVKGYVFYHFQSTERAVEAGQLFLAYGCIEEDESALVSVANKIVAELRQVGLDVNWQGDSGHPIVVDGIVWRKRR
jgi:hypothetical protein